MQLKYSSKLGSNAEVPSSYAGLGGNNGFSDFYGGGGGGKSVGNVVELPNIHSDSGGGRFGGGGGGGGGAGIKPVDTKRPFTPRDNVSLWGVSARKRPPSAIT